MKGRNCTRTDRATEQDDEEEEEEPFEGHSSERASAKRPSTSFDCSRISPLDLRRRRRWRKFAVDKKSSELPVAHICAKTRWAPTPLTSRLGAPHTRIIRPIHVRPRGGKFSAASVRRRKRFVIVCLIAGLETDRIILNPQRSQLHSTSDLDRTRSAKMQ